VKDEDARERKPISGAMQRSNSAVFLPDVVKMRDSALVRYENLLTRTQIEELTKRIENGEIWIAEHRGKDSVAKIDAAKTKLLGLKRDRAKIIYENELPFVALDAVADLLQRTTTLGAVDPAGGYVRMEERLGNAYIRVSIPGSVTFEADLVLPDIPF
jgi:hypothetical protein